MARTTSLPGVILHFMRGPQKHLALFGLLLAVCAPNAATGHSPSGVKLTGTVRDETGAFIPNALVRLFSTDQVRATKTDAAGRFEFSGLSSGTYDLQTSPDGFLAKTVEGVHVDNQDVGPIQLIAPIVHGSGRCVVVTVPGDLSYENRSGKTNLIAKIVDTSG